jgi:hypothetical protein
MSKAIMIDEATKAKMELVAELRLAVEVGNTQGEWFADRVEALAYYNSLLMKLGAAQ